jgi:hypothetical protein
MSDVESLMVPARASARRARRLPAIFVVPLAASAISAWPDWDAFCE